MTEKADKTLRIIFTGISTLTPGPPRNGDKPPDKAFVMMAANIHGPSGKRGTQINEWGAVLPDHFPFVHVAASLLVNPPTPAETVVVGEGGEHFIYFYQDARVVIHPAPKKGTRIEYFIDPEGRPLADRPGSDDVAPPGDIRWLADIRDILSKPAPLKETANPNKPITGEEVAAIVNLDGGQLKAGFACATTFPKTLMDAKRGTVVPGLRRVMAGEIIIDIPYPKETDRITLEFQPLREGRPVNGPKELVLAWPKKQAELVLRMGSDTKNEVRLLDTPEYCDPVRLVGPVLTPRDDDFDLHYNLVVIPDDAGRPLPQNDIQQCGVEDCKPMVV